MLLSSYNTRNNNNNNNKTKQTHTHTRPKTKPNVAQSESTRKQRPTVSVNPHLREEGRRMKRRRKWSNITHATLLLSCTKVCIYINLHTLRPLLNTQSFKSHAKFTVWFSCDTLGCFPLVATSVAHLTKKGGLAPKRKTVNSENKNVHSQNISEKDLQTTNCGSWHLRAALFVLRKGTRQTQVVQGFESRLRASHARRGNFGKTLSGFFPGLSRRADHSDWEAAGAYISAGRTFPRKWGGIGRDTFDWCQIWWNPPTYPMNRGSYTIVYPQSNSNIKS